MLTYFDDRTGERVDLSAQELGAWSARTAGLLREGCGLHPGSRVAVLLPPHWQTAAVLLGAWSAGLTVSVRLAATAGLTPLEPPLPLDASFVARSRIGSWIEDVPDARHKYVLGLGPRAVPLDDVPPGYLDFISEIRLYAESPPPFGDVRPTDPATADGTTYGEWAATARGLAETIGIGPGDRVLVDAAEHEHPLKWLLAPLVAGASVVLCANLDRSGLTARITREGVTKVL